MSDNTVFQSNPKTDTPQAVQPSSSSPPVSTTSVPPVISQGGIPQSPVSSPPPSAPPPIAPPYEERASILPLLLKIAGVIIGLGIIVLVVIQFVLPRFSQKAPEKVTLTYWGLWEDKRTMQGVIDEFQRQNPKITINYQKQDIKQYKDKLLTRTQNGAGPDIFRFHNTWVSQLNSLLTPLPVQVITGEQFKKQYYPVTQQDLIKNGGIYGIPLEIDTLVLFVNTEAFNAAGLTVPTTWEQFTDTARTLTVKDENGKIKTAGAAMGTYDNITHAPDIISLLFAQNGANLRELSATSRNASETLEFYTSFAKGDASVWDDTLDPSLLAFAKGNVAMYFGYSWDVFTIRAFNPDLVFAVNPVPHLPGRSMTISNY